mgnify:CR=1 FL=1
MIGDPSLNPCERHRRIVSGQLDAVQRDRRIADQVGTSSRSKHGSIAARRSRARRFLGPSTRSRSRRRGRHPSALSSLKRSPTRPRRERRRGSRPRPRKSRLAASREYGAGFSRRLPRRRRAERAFHQRPDPKRSMPHGRGRILRSPAPSSAASASRLHRSQWTSAFLDAAGRRLRAELLCELLRELLQDRLLVLGEAEPGAQAAVERDVNRTPVAITRTMWFADEGDLLRGPSTRRTRAAWRRAPSSCRG